MIIDREAAWLREFLLERCETDLEKKEAKDIINTFRKLWKVARAIKANPIGQSERLKKALADLQILAAK